jgi:hypothetical protein
VNEYSCCRSPRTASSRPRHARCRAATAPTGGALESPSPLALQEPSSRELQEPQPPSLSALQEPQPPLPVTLQEPSSCTLSERGLDGDGRWRWDEELVGSSRNLEHERRRRLLRV